MVAAVAVAVVTRTGGWLDFVELETQVWLSSDFVENNAAVAGGSIAVATVIGGIGGGGVDISL